MSDLEVKAAFVIGKEEVVKVDQFAGIEVYLTYDEDDDGTTAKAYFVKNSKVVRVLRVEADCGQNTGFISGFNFSKP